MCEYAKNIAQWISSTFGRAPAKIYTLKPCRDSGKRFEESLLGGEVVDNLEIF